MRKNLIVGAMVLGLSSMLFGGACAMNDEPALDLRHMDSATAESLIGQRMATDKETLEAHLRAFLVMTDSEEFDVEITDWQPITAESNIEQLVWQAIGHEYALIHGAHGSDTFMRGAPAAPDDHHVSRLIREDAPLASYFGTIRWSKGAESWTTHAFVYSGARVGNPWEVLEPVTGISIAVATQSLISNRATTASPTLQPQTAEFTPECVKKWEGAAKEIGRILCDWFPDLCAAICDVAPHLPFCTATGVRADLDDTWRKCGTTDSAIPVNTGLYAGVALDLFYDHLLAVYWGEHHPEPLPEFTRRMYALLEANHEHLPERTRQMLPYMVQGDWLTGYARIEGLARALGGLSRRAANASALLGAERVLVENYPAYRAEFTAFFAEVKEHTRSFRA